ncbi:hypothetical protein AB0G04_44110 [Actinoplanes sp. NPDC023801]|uniref:hypothetical protein n=1 Tax=Actinoplanes sp. NPDC023801 TaxID=3154595 RepID=UPI0033D001F5
MTRGGGIRWLGWLVAGSIAVAGGVWVLVTWLTADQLSTADQTASVVAAAVALLGVPIAVYGLSLARRGTASANPATPGEVRQKVSSGGTANVAGGDLTIGRARGHGGSDLTPGGRVRQDVHAGKDANVAGGDLTVEQSRGQR